MHARARRIPRGIFVIGIARARTGAVLLNDFFLSFAPRRLSLHKGRTDALLNSAFRLERITAAAAAQYGSPPPLPFHPFISVTFSAAQHKKSSDDGILGRCGCQPLFGRWSGQHSRERGGLDLECGQHMEGPRRHCSNDTLGQENQEIFVIPGNRSLLKAGAARFPIANIMCLDSRRDEFQIWKGGGKKFISNSDCVRI